MQCKSSWSSQWSSLQSPSLCSWASCSPCLRVDYSTSLDCVKSLQVNTLVSIRLLEKGTTEKLCLLIRRVTDLKSAQNFSNVSQLSVQLKVVFSDGFTCSVVVCVCFKVWQTYPPLSSTHSTTRKSFWTHKNCFRDILATALSWPGCASLCCCVAGSYTSTCVRKSDQTKEEQCQRQHQQQSN